MHNQVGLLDFVGFFDSLSLTYPLYLIFANMLTLIANPKPKIFGSTFEKFRNPPSLPNCFN